jgi:hypothetical protein
LCSGAENSLEFGGHDNKHVHIIFTWVNLVGLLHALGHVISMSRSGHSIGNFISNILYGNNCFGFNIKIYLKKSLYHFFL